MNSVRDETNLIDYLNSSIVSSYKSSRLDILRIISDNIILEQDYIRIYLNMEIPGIINEDHRNGY